MKNTLDKREKEIVKAGLLGVLLNLVLVVGKGIIGFVSGSLAIILDAVNNLTDILSALVTVIGAKLAGRKPDKEHPFGHGRAEYLAALLVGVVILGAGVEALLKSIPEIFNAVLPNYSFLTILLLIVAILVKLGFGWYAKQKGKMIKSRSLEATGIDAVCDAVLTFGTLVAAGVGIVFGISIDGIVGTVIALFIIRTSIKILIEGWIDIIGRRVDSKLSRNIKKILLDFPEVNDVSELVLHSYGPTKIFGAAKIKVSPEMKVSELASVTKKIEEEIFEREQVKLVIGV